MCRVVNNRTGRQIDHQVQSSRMVFFVGNLIIFYILGTY